MIKWIKKILGIDLIEREIFHMYEVIGRLEKKISYHVGKSMRYDQIERARKRRYKTKAA